MMSVFVILFLFLRTCNGNFIERCNSAGDVCEKFPENSNRDALLEILTWWNQMSLTKPLKCSGLPVYHSEFDTERSTKPIFKSRQCKPNEQLFGNRGFAFKGKIENFQFQGPGKYKDGVWDDGQEFLQDICIDHGRTEGKSIKSIVSNFKDGSPNGISKLELEGGAIQIANYINGVRHGFTRYWDSLERLHRLGYHFHGKYKGYMWHIIPEVNDTVAFALGAPVNAEAVKEADNGYPMILFTNNFTLALGGFFTQGILTHARYIRIEKVTIQDCFLQPLWSYVEGKPFKFNSHTKEIRYHDEVEKKNHPLCQDEETWNVKDIASSVDQWISQVASMPYDGLWTDEPSNIPIDNSARKILSNVFQDKEDNSLCHANILGSDTVFSFEVIKETEENPCDIRGVVSLEFLKNQTSPEFPLLNATIRKIDGYSSELGFEGSVTFTITDGTFITAKAKQNVLHGPFVRLGRRVVFPMASEFADDDGRHLLSDGFGGFGNFINGNLEGLLWLRLIGGGFLYGPVDNQGSFTGDEMAFVYPDMETAYVGRFQNFIMIKGQKARITGERCNKLGVKELRLSKPDGPFIFFSPPTNTSFGEGPKIRDPYEEKFVQVRKSPIAGAGEGVFAMNDIPSGQVACFYAGFTYRNEEEKNIYNARYLNNESLTDDERRWASKYSIGLGEISSLNIPIELDRPGIWLPSAAPKLNSAFEKRGKNCVFSHFEHPRWGLIMAAYPDRNITAGDELFTDYGYKEAKFPYDFPWYHEMKAKYLKELEEEEEEKMEKEIKKKTKKKKKVKSLK